MHAAVSWLLAPYEIAVHASFSDIFFDLDSSDIVKMRQKLGFLLNCPPDDPRRQHLIRFHTWWNDIENIGRLDEICPAHWRGSTYRLMYPVQNRTETQANRLCDLIGTGRSVNVFQTQEIEMLQQGTVGPFTIWCSGFEAMRPCELLNALARAVMKEEIGADVAYDHLVHMPMPIFAHAYVLVYLQTLLCVACNTRVYAGVAEGCRPSQGCSQLAQVMGCWQYAQELRCWEHVQRLPQMDFETVDRDGGAGR